MGYYSTYFLVSIYANYGFWLFKVLITVIS